MTTPGRAAATTGAPRSPMDLDFTNEQDMLRDAVRGLCADAAETVRSLEDDP